MHDGHVVHYAVPCGGGWRGGGAGSDLWLELGRNGLLAVLMRIGLNAEGSGR